MLNYLVPLLCVLSAPPQPELPQVLIVGDAVYREPARLVAQELKGLALVSYRSLPNDEVLTSHSILSHWDSLIGDTEWTIILCNVGLGDLCYRAPGMKSLRLLPKHAGGVRRTTPQEYQANISAIAARFQQSAAGIVWMSTTPIRSSPTGVYEPGSEAEYNRIARSVMDDRGIPVLDMHAHVVNVIDMSRPAPHNADPFNFDRKPIHEPITATIRTIIGEKEEPTTAAP